MGRAMTPTTDPSNSPRSSWRWLTLLLLPASAYAAAGPAGVIVLAVPHLLIAIALMKTDGQALRATAMGALLAGGVGALLMAATHDTAERRYLLAAVILGTLGAAVAAGVGAVRCGKRRVGWGVLAAAGAYLLLGLLVLASQPSA
jgi:hypothetical protein